MAHNVLITRCPDCQTSFRITLETLNKAGGRVRCGRCEVVFSAFNSLADTRTDLKALGAEEITLESKRAVGGDVVVTEPGGRADADPELISEREVDQVLETASGTVEPAPPWTLPPQSAQSRAHGAWTLAGIAALGVLLGQLAHHFRSTLVTLPLIGEPLGAIYSRVGAPVQTDADPGDYEIVNWMATARADRQTEATLLISAGIHNRSNEPRPLPLLFLKLTDRFDNPIGTRYFEPTEYLDAGSGTLIAPGATADARLELLDPGPQAFGFEVDVCVRLGATALRCKADTVFD